MLCKIRISLTIHTIYFCLTCAGVLGGRNSKWLHVSPEQHIALDLRTTSKSVTPEFTSLSEDVVNVQRHSLTGQPPSRSQQPTQKMTEYACNIRCVNFKEKRTLPTHFSATSAGLEIPLTRCRAESMMRSKGPSTSLCSLSTMRVPLYICTGSSKISPPTHSKEEKFCHSQVLSVNHV